METIVSSWPRGLLHFFQLTWMVPRLGIEAWLHPPESVLWRVKNPRGLWVGVGRARAIWVLGQSGRMGYSVNGACGAIFHLITQIDRMACGWEAGPAKLRSFEDAWMVPICRQLSNGLPMGGTGSPLGQVVAFPGTTNGTMLLRSMICSNCFWNINCTSLQVCICLQVEQWLRHLLIPFPQSSSSPWSLSCFPLSSLLPHPPPHLRGNPHGIRI